MTGVNRGARISGREDSLRAMATGAIGYDLRSELRCQSVVARQIGSLATSGYTEFLRQPNSFVAAGAGSLRNVLGRHRRIRVRMRLDGMDPVAIRARRSLPISFRQRRAVDAPLELFGDGVVALAAGLRHIELENRRLRILCVKDLVSAVAIGADRCFGGAIGHRMPVNALPIRGDH